MKAIKDWIRDYALKLGADDVGFASITDYNSPQSPDILGLFPTAKSLVVMAFKEAAHCVSPSNSIAMNGRLEITEFIRYCSFKLTRFLEREFHIHAMSVPSSYPLDMNSTAKGLIGEVSLRHAALAAGLGSFGRHNLIIHPRLGTQVVYQAVINELDLPSDPPFTEDLCTYCDVCVENCPAGALDIPGKTDALKCLRYSQPYGMGGLMAFGRKLLDSPTDTRKKMLTSPDLMKLYQAQMVGMHYYCFKCYTSCPIGNDSIISPMGINDNK